MSRRAKIILAVVALLVIGGVASYIAFGGATGGVQVDTAQVADEDLALTVTASGKVGPGLRVDVYPPTAGTLESVNVDDGDEVKQGDVLAQMDRVPLEAAVAQARVALAGAESQLAAISKQQPSAADLTAARAGTDAAWAAYEAALESAEAADQGAPSSADLKAAAAAERAAYESYQIALEAFKAVELVFEASQTPSPSLESTYTSSKIAKDQAEAAYYQAKSAHDSLRAFDATAAQANAGAAADQAYAGYLSARAQQMKLEETCLSAERRAAQASVDQAREALVVAQENLTKATIRAPIDGTVLFNAAGAPVTDGSVPTAAAGAAVGPQAPPFTVVDLDGLTFVAEVDEVDVSRLETGMSAVVSLDAVAEESFETEVAQIEPAAQLTATGGTVFPVQLPLDGKAEANVLLGMKGDAEIEVSKVPGAATVPIEALFDEGGTTYVYVVDGDVLKRTEVEIGTLTETRVEILSGVEPGATVALSGATELVDGMRVSVTD